MDEEVKRWTAKRKSALVLEIIQGKTTVAGSRKRNTPTFPLAPAARGWLN
jgi:hypothetical protein